MTVLEDYDIIILTKNERTKIMNIKILSATLGAIVLIIGGIFAFTSNNQNELNELPVIEDIVTTSVEEISVEIEEIEEIEEVVIPLSVTTAPVSLSITGSGEVAVTVSDVEIETASEDVSFDAIIGDTNILTITPKEGHEIFEITVNGESLEINTTLDLSPYTQTALDTNLSVAITFNEIYVEPVIVETPAPVVVETPSFSMDYSKYTGQSLGTQGNDSITTPEEAAIVLDAYTNPNAPKPSHGFNS